jgi:4-hydroxy-2-oxoheptanedioate aldolase
MDLPRNAFKAALKAGRLQTGIWNTIPGPVVTEVLALAGFDWVLVDTEHAPVEVTDVLPALQVLAAYPAVSALVRPAWNDTVLIKRHLDQGAQTLLIPYVETPEAARAAVAAVRYPPDGVRGIGGLTRATRYGRIPDYVARAADEICLLVQVETARALADIEAIATTPGVDGVFIGPADLSASLGHPGNAGHPDVRTAIEGAITTLKRLGVPSGILTLDEDFTRRCIELGATFPALGIDTSLLGRGLHDLRTRFS